MTYCMNAKLSRVGSESSSLSRIGGNPACTATAIGGMADSMSLMGRISCSMYQVCSVNVNMHYLEINPKIVWLLAGHTENDVYSNTRWRID